MKKKFSFVIATLIAIGIWAFIILVTGGCSQHYCPTYSKQPTTSNQRPA